MRTKTVLMRIPKQNLITEWKIVDHEYHDGIRTWFTRLSHSRVFMVNTLPHLTVVAAVTLYNKTSTSQYPIQVSIFWKKKFSLSSIRDSCGILSRRHIADVCSSPLLAFGHPYAWSPFWRQALNTIPFLSPPEDTPSLIHHHSYAWSPFWRQALTTIPFLSPSEDTPSSTHHHP